MSKLSAYTGPALFSFGFRPFFLGGAIFAGATVLLWLAVFQGDLQLPTAFAPRDWHVHEMTYGYAGAIIAGFLLTAIPNWTGRLPFQGRPLMLLSAAWLAGRLSVSFSAMIGWVAATLIDTSFLLLLTAAAAREIIAGRKWGNLKIVGLVCVFSAINVAFHIEAHIVGVAEYSTRAGMALVIALIGMVGGRIIPSFTRNWLARQHPGRMPVPFNRFDGLTMAASALGLALWILQPTGRVIAILFAGAGLLHAVRLARWCGYRTLRDPLVLVLHLGYAFVPAGFILLALAADEQIPSTAGVHAWAGAIAVMTLAVMTRASLGHTGRELSASAVTQAVYSLIILAALARMCAALEPAISHVLLPLAAAAWALGFIGFVIGYGPMLCRSRKS